jgi:phosphatidylserine decarboxylase
LTRSPGDDHDDGSDVPPHWRLLLRLLAGLPQRALSRFTGRIARIPIPARLRASILGAFVRSAGIDTTEIEHAVSDYPTLDAFFVRRLRDGVRTWPDDPVAIASPVDGIIGRSGTIRDGRVLQAKGRFYSAADILGDAEAARAFDGGEFLTLYLSPRHYHRIHSPARGRIRSARHVPGALMPVNPPAMSSIEDLLPRNERLICSLAAEPGRIAIIAVGAFNVGRITAAFDATLVTNRRGAVAFERTYDPAIDVGRGDEIMVFHLGSTVVLLFEPDTVRPVEGLTAGREIRLGQPIASSLHS